MIRVFGVTLITVWCLTGAAFAAAGAQGANVVEVPQTTRINTDIQSGWKESGIAPSAPATDSEFCRRLYLDLLGRTPTVAELQAYSSDKRENRKWRLVQTLLHDEAYTIDFADHWSTIWANILLGRPTNDNQDTPVDRAGLEKFLRDSLARNKSYDQLVRELITAVGTNRPGSPQFNGAVNYLSGKLADNATQATAATSRIFLGLQVQCTQCHNHPFNDWKQNQFWQLNAFFRQTAALRRYKNGTRDVDHYELANQDFGGEDNPLDPAHARVYYELRNGKLEEAFPVFIDGTAIGRSGYLSEVNRRNELATLIVHSPNFSRAMVNRLWAHFLGYGFTRPIDDMGPHNPPILPDLLDYLAQQFQENSYDQRQLMSWIVMSDAYGLSSRTSAQNEKDDPTAGSPPQFSHFYVRHMTAEQLYRSLLTASQADLTQGSLAQQQAAQREWLKQFTLAFGTDEGGEATTFDGTITQTLMMFNGDLMKQATGGAPGSFLYRIAADDRQRPVAKIQQLTLAAVARTPDPKEIKAYQQLLLFHQQDELSALQDLWWALLNSNEFILNH